MVKIFISHKRNHPETRSVLSVVRATLEALDYEVLVDEDIEGGDRWQSQLYRWLLECHGAVILASRASTESDWCQREWAVLAARAAVSNLRVVPVHIDIARGSADRIGFLQALEVDESLAARLTNSFDGLNAWNLTPEEFLVLHRAWLSNQFELEPVLGQRFSLKDIYVDQDCGELRWEEMNDHFRPLDPFHEQHGGRHDLLELVLKRISDPEFRDVIVVQGPAGAGKSAFCLRLALELNELGGKPLLIRFRDMRLALFDDVDEMLSDASRIGPDDQQSPRLERGLLGEQELREAWNFRGAQICRTTVILDGWDEVSLANSADFQATLRAWLPKLRQYFVRPGIPVRLIITGRPSLEVKESSLLSRRTSVMTLRPMQVERLEMLARRLARCSNWDLTPARYGPVLARYASRAQSHFEMIGLPLLAVLAFRTLSTTTEDSEDILTDRTNLYKALIDQTVVNAGKGEDVGLHNTIHRGGRALRTLLQRTAAMVTLQRSERISFAELDHRLRDDDGNVDEWVADATKGNALHALVINFWFKGGRHDYGCEFLHKSFREYLFAEHIVAILLGLSEHRTEDLAPPDLKYWQDFRDDSVQYQASRALSRVLAPQWLTPEVRNHVFALIRSASKEQPYRWRWIRDLLADVYGWWAEGKHMRQRPARTKHGDMSWEPSFADEIATWTMPKVHEARKAAEPMRLITLDAHLGDALLNITAFVHDQKFPKRLQPMSREYQARGRFRPGGQGFLRHLVARIDAAGFRHAGQGLNDVYLAGTEMSRESLEGVSFASADLSRASLVGANLSRCDLQLAHLNGTVLTDATMTHCRLSVRDLFRYKSVQDGERKYLLPKRAKASWAGALLPEHLAALSYESGAAPMNWRAFEIYSSAEIGLVIERIDDTSTHDAV